MYIPLRLYVKKKHEMKEGGGEKQDISHIKHETKGERFYLLFHAKRDTYKDVSSKPRETSLKVYTSTHFQKEFHMYMYLML